MTTLKYFGWSSISIESAAGTLVFDPFYREYCEAKWANLPDFTNATVVCITHGHEEHFLDVPEVLKATTAIAVGAPATCRFLKKRNGIPTDRLRAVEPSTFETVSVPGFRITALPWEHRDINLWKALTKAVLQGNATQLKWAWSSATNAPFYSPYTGFLVELPEGLRILNYNEGFNSKMTDAQIAEIRRRFNPDVVLGGMQLNFVEDVARGIAALDPRVAILYPPHEKFHEMMGVVSEPWDKFANAVKARCPRTEVHIALPGFALNIPSSRAAMAA